MEKKTFRHNVTFPIELKNQLEFITQATGQSTSQVISEICAQSVPELYEICKTALDAKSDPKTAAHVLAMKKIIDVMENH